MTKRNRSDDLAVKLRQKSVEDKVKGKVNELVGKGRNKLGRLTANGTEQMKGKVQEWKGKVQQKKGDIEEDLSIARDRSHGDDDSQL